MSVLNRLKKASSAQATRLFEKHPIANEPLELRLQYLSAVAFATAIDREPNTSERATFLALAKSLSVDESDAQEQLQERASISDDDINTLFSQIKSKDLSWPYMMDLIWIHQSDDSHASDEKEALKAVVDLLGVEEKICDPLSKFLLAYRKGDFPGCVVHDHLMDKSELVCDIFKILMNKKNYKVYGLVAPKVNELITLFGVATTVPDAEIISWSKSIGDCVSYADVYARIGSNLLKSPVDGVIGPVIKNSGSIVCAGERVGFIYAVKS